MASIAYIEDRRPSDPSRVPDDLVLTGVLYRVEEGVYLFRAGAHHRDGAGKRRHAAEPYRHEAGAMVVTEAQEARVVRDFIAWFDERVADWDHALRDGAALYPLIGTAIDACHGTGAKVFDAQERPSCPEIVA